MRIWRGLAAAVLACGCLSGPARAGGEACVEVPGIGCCYAAGDLRNPEKPDLLVYFRGHLSVDSHPEWGKSHPEWVKQFTGVPPAQIPDPLLAASARQAFEYYGLKGVADASRLVVLVTGSSYVPVHAAALQALAADKLKLRGKRFGAVHLAAHSGGFVGLNASKLRPDAGGGAAAADGFASIQLLDNFYSPARLAATVKGYQDAGAACGGYFTPHNADRAASIKKTCELKAFDSDAEHEAQVGPVLSERLGAFYAAQDAPAGSSAHGSSLKKDADFVSKFKPSGF